ncbi:MAG: hypothetical protein AB1758_19840 [Candidatus Eremiobacterota bacterium]
MHTEISKLLEFESPTSPVISLYLDTRPAPSGMREGQRVRPYQIWLKARLKSLGQEVAHAARPSFDRDLRRIEEFLSNVESRTRGVAIFACDGAGLFRTFQVEEPFENQASLGAAPLLYPIVRYLNTHLEYAVLVADEERARIYAVRLGQISEAVAVAHPRELPEQTGHRAGGVSRPGLQRASSGPGFGASEIKYQRYLRQQTRKHLEEVVAALRRVMEREKLSLLVLAGKEAVTSEVESLLPPDLKQCLKAEARVPLTAGLDEIMRQTRSRLEQALNADRDRKAASLVEEYLAGGLGVVGARETLDALFRGQVDELLVSPNFQARVRMCTSCTQPVLADLKRCPVCEGELGPDTDGREVLATLAEKADALMQVVPSPGPLDAHGGIGASLRYRSPGNSIGG